MKKLTYTHLVPTEDGKAFVDQNGKTWQPLNSKQKLFCKEYIKGQTATEAAIKAGYTKDRKGAKTQGSVLTLLYETTSLTWKYKPRRRKQFP